jgi:hypothetical protein
VLTGAEGASWASAADEGAAAAAAADAAARPPYRAAPKCSMCTSTEHNACMCPRWQATS